MAKFIPILTSNKKKHPFNPFGRSCSKFGPKILGNTGARYCMATIASTDNLTFSLGQDNPDVTASRFHHARMRTSKLNIRNGFVP